jgi:hypothetical protein
MMAPWLDELSKYPSTQFFDTVMASFFAREGVLQGKAAAMSIRRLN